MRHVIRLTIEESVMQATLTASPEVPVESGRSLTRDYVAYITITYAFTWTLLIVGVKLG